MFFRWDSLSTTVARFEPFVNLGSMGRSNNVTLKDQPLNPKTKGSNRGGDRFFPALFRSRRSTPMPTKSVSLTCLSLIAAAVLFAGMVAAEVRNMATEDRWLQHDILRQKPTVVETDGSASRAHATKDAIMLFDGTNLDAWRTPEGGPARWKVTNGFVEIAAGTGPIESKGKFGDVQLHVEWASPSPPAGKGQGRGNSGVFLMGLYEIQVLDSYRADTYADGQAGAIYGQYPPLFNASRPPGEWQTYDVAFRRPRFDKNGKLLEPARVTLIHNGILVQNNEELWGGTNWLESSPYEAHADRGRIELQDHGHPVRFRNFWVRELPERPMPTAEDRARPTIISLSAAALDRIAPANMRWVEGRTRSPPRSLAPTDTCCSRWPRDPSRWSCSPSRRPSSYYLTPMPDSPFSGTIRAG